jgi:hypothetical protein
VSYGRVQGKAAQYQYWQPAIYFRHALKDGRQVWKYYDHLGTARRSYRLANSDARELAARLAIPCLGGIRQWTPIEPAPEA